MKKEEDLIISKSDTLLKSRYAVKLDANAKAITLQYPFEIINAKLKSSKVNLKIQKKNSHSIVVKFPGKAKQDTILSFEISVLIDLERKKIGNIKVISWSAIDLYRVFSTIKPYNVIGFGQRKIMDQAYVYSNNLTSGISSHISKKRNTRIEMGQEQSIKLGIQYQFDCTNGAQISSFRSFGPINSRRQNSTFLGKEANIKRDDNNNEVYQLKNHIGAGQIKTHFLEWKVKLPPPSPITTNLGTMKALKIAKKESEKFDKYISGDNNWPTNHPFVQQVVDKVKDMETIFKVHQFLFEFVNRYFTYKENRKRLPITQAIKTKTGDCSEYADLLVTLHRAAGIPSRFVEGIYIDVENGKKVSDGHAWVEFLTTSGWIHCDPTLGILLGVTSQHIEFNSQTDFEKTEVYSMKFKGPEPKINYKIVWD